jgi:hypothetical protein
MKNVSDKICTENQNTTFIFNDRFSKIVLFMRSCGKILQSGTGHRWQYGACALHTVYLRLQHRPRICNTYRFSTTTMVARTCLNVTSYVHCLSCCLLSIHSVTNTLLRQTRSVCHGISKAESWIRKYWVGGDHRLVGIIFWNWCKKSRELVPNLRGCSVQLAKMR